MTGSSRYVCALFLLGALTVNAATTPTTITEASASTSATSGDVIADTSSPSSQTNSASTGATPVVESSRAMTTPTMTSQSETTNKLSSSSSVTEANQAVSLSGFTDLTTQQPSSHTTRQTLSVTSSQNGSPTGTPDVINTNDTGLTPVDGGEVLVISESPFTPDNSVLPSVTVSDDTLTTLPANSAVVSTTTPAPAPALPDTTTANTPLATTVVSAAAENTTPSSSATTGTNSVPGVNSAASSNSLPALSNTTPGTGSVAAMDTTPVAAMGTAPNAAMGTTPIAAMGTTPGAAMGTTPNAAVGTTTNAAMGTTLTNNAAAVSTTAGPSGTLNAEMSNSSPTVSTTTIQNPASGGATATNNFSNNAGTTTNIINSTPPTVTAVPSVMETTTVLQSVQDIINGFTATTTPPAPTTTADPCNLRPAQQCVSSLMTQLRTLLDISRYVTNIASVVPWMCASYPRYRRCILSSASTCSREQRLNHYMIVSAMDYVCSAHGPNAVGEALPCLRNRNTTQGVAFCGRLAYNMAFSQGVCGMSQHYVNCVGKVYELKCSYAAGHAVKNILHRATLPLRSMLRCPAFVIPPTTTTTTTTTLPPPPAPATTKPPAPPVNVVLPGTGASTPVGTAVNNTTSTASASPANSLQLKCYECDSGDPRGPAYNSRCAVDGEVSRLYIRATPCSTPCYSRTNKTPAGSVKRGCTAGLEKLFPGGVIPTRGCHRRAGEVWCFCSRNACNKRDMENFLTVEAP